MGGNERGYKQKMRRRGEAKRELEQGIQRTASEVEISRGRKGLTTVWLYTLVVFEIHSDKIIIHSLLDSCYSAIKIFSPLP